MDGVPLPDGEAAAPDPGHAPLPESTSEVGNREQDTVASVATPSNDTKPWPYPTAPEVTTVEANPNSVIQSVSFVDKPPGQLRKSNFFNFSLRLSDKSGKAIQFQQARFVAFVGTQGGDSGGFATSGRHFKNCNGVQYSLSICRPDGVVETESLIVRLIDASTKQLVPYEGQDRNPELQRVLLTHEVSCMRCIERRSCGNKTDAPSDPALEEDGCCIRFYLKCNQNCLKYAGNPRDFRRFSVAIGKSTSLNPDDYLAVSGAMFVHNNSKHGRGSFKPLTDSTLRAIARKLTTDKDNCRSSASPSAASDLHDTAPSVNGEIPEIANGHRPVAPQEANARESEPNHRSHIERVHVEIEAIIPSQGYLQGGEVIHVVGTGFLPGMYVVMAKDGRVVELLSTNVISPHLLLARTSSWHVPGPVDVCIGSDAVSVVLTRPASFYYDPADEEPSLRAAVDRLSKTVPFVDGDEQYIAASIVVVRAAEVLERLAEFGELTRASRLRPDPTRRQAQAPYTNYPVAPSRVMQARSSEPGQGSPYAAVPSEWRGSMFSDGQVYREEGYQYHDWTGEEGLPIRPQAYNVSQYQPASAGEHSGVPTRKPSDRLEDQRGTQWRRPHSETGRSNSGPVTARKRRMEEADGGDATERNGDGQQQQQIRRKGKVSVRWTRVDMPKSKTRLPRHGAQGKPHADDAAEHSQESGSSRAECSDDEAANHHGGSEAREPAVPREDTKAADLPAQSR